MSKKKIIVLKYFCLCLLWVLFFKVDFVNSVIAPIFENFNFEIKNNLIKEGDWNLYFVENHGSSFVSKSQFKQITNDYIKNIEFDDFMDFYKEKVYRGGFKKVEYASIFNCCLPHFCRIDQGVCRIKLSSHDWNNSISSFFLILEKESSKDEVYFSGIVNFPDKDIQSSILEVSEFKTENPHKLIFEFKGSHTETEIRIKGFLRVCWEFIKVLYEYILLAIVIFILIIYKK